MRSPAASTCVQARRVAPPHCTCTSIPSSASRAADSRPSASSPSAVKSSQRPASSASWRATTAPPPAGSSQTRSACTISPAAGMRGTRANSTHSTWPTTAHLTIPHPATFHDHGDDGHAADPAVRALLPRASRRGARLSPAAARRTRRGRVAGDVPARAARVRPARARAPPARVGVHDRDERRARRAAGEAANRPQSPTSSRSRSCGATRSASSSI